MNSYCFTIDTGNWDGAASLFEHGSWQVEGATPIIGKQEVLAVLSKVKTYEDGTPKTKHVTSNVDLLINEPAGTASSECYVTVFQQTDELPLQVIFSGHYFDQFERVNGSWRFTRRLIRHTLVGNMSAHLKEPSDVIPKA
jgi:hypothetical protein